MNKERGRTTNNTGTKTNRSTKPPAKSNTSMIIDSEPRADSPILDWDDNSNHNVAMWGRQLDGLSAGSDEMQQQLDKTEQQKYFHASAYMETKQGDNNQIPLTKADIGCRNFFERKPARQHVNFASLLNWKEGAPSLSTGKGASFPKRATNILKEFDTVFGRSSSRDDCWEPLSIGMQQRQPDFTTSSSTNSQPFELDNSFQSAECQLINLEQANPIFLTDKAALGLGGNSTTTAPSNSLHPFPHSVNSHYQPQLAALADSSVYGGDTMQHCGHQREQLIDGQAFSHDVKSKKGGGNGTMLPLDFTPQPYSVVVGKGKESKNVIGNNRLRVLASIYLEKYNAALTDNDRNRKTEILSTIIGTIRDACPVGAFIKLDKTTGRWYEVTDSNSAREKVGYTFRELLGDKYKSSSKSKCVKRSVARKRKFDAKKKQDETMNRILLRKSSPTQDI